MKRMNLFITFLCTSVLVVFSVDAAEIDCDANDPSLLVVTGSVITDPASFGVPRELIPGPTTYTERLELKKVSAGRSLAGSWLISRLFQDQQSPAPGNMNFSIDNKVEMLPGYIFDCHMEMTGASFENDCTSNNARLNFINGKILHANTGTRVGSYSGKQVTLQFGRGNKQFNPALKGTWNPNAPREGKHLSLNIEFIYSPQQSSGRKHVFSDGNPGELGLKYHAVVTPPEYAASVVWSVPDIGDSSLSIEPTTKRGEDISLIYSGLPMKNSDFGEKWLKASLKIDDCEISEQESFQVFFPARPSNNPNTDDTLPNWFYYWAQSPAGQIGDFVTPIMIYAENHNDCSTGNPAFFNESRPKDINICDLANLPTGPFTINYPVISSTPPYYPLRANRTAEYIDTFASAVVHEFEHLKAAWHRKHAAIPTDADNDGLVDLMEPQLNFNPAKTVTHLAAMETEIWGWATNPVKTQKFIDTMRDVIKWDEEWLAYEVQGQYVLGTYRKYDWAYPGSQWE